MKHTAKFFLDTTAGAGPSSLYGWGTPLPEIAGSSEGTGSGAARVDDVLQVANFINGDGAAAQEITYKWYQDDVFITGETNPTYTPVTADIGATIKVGVTINGVETFSIGYVISALNNFTLTSEYTLISPDPLSYEYGLDANVPMGSIDAATYGGATILAFSTLTGGGVSATAFVLSGNRAQDFFTSITINGFTLESASAYSYQYEPEGDDTVWVWVVDAITAATMYPVVITP